MSTYKSLQRYPVSIVLEFLLRKTQTTLNSTHNFKAPPELQQPSLMLTVHFSLFPTYP